jgi:hypothetical protein
MRSTRAELASSQAVSPEFNSLRTSGGIRRPSESEVSILLWSFEQTRFAYGA